MLEVKFFIKALGTMPQRSPLPVAQELDSPLSERINRVVIVRFLAHSRRVSWGEEGSVVALDEWMGGGKERKCSYLRIWGQDVV